MQSDCRVRKTNHYLPIEAGRWRNIDRGTIAVTKILYIYQTY